MYVLRETQIYKNVCCRIRHYKVITKTDKTILPMSGVFIMARVHKGGRVGHFFTMETVVISIAICGSQLHLSTLSLGAFDSLGRDQQDYAGYKFR